MPHSHSHQAHLSQFEVKPISEHPRFGEMQTLHRLRRKGRQTVTHQNENIGIKQHHQLRAHHISTNQHGIYQVKITPPLSLKISGHTRSHYFVALKTDEPQHAISRAKAVFLQAKCFFQNNPHDLPDSLSLSQQLLVQIHLIAKHFPVIRAYKHKPSTYDFPTLPPLDLSNAEEDIRFPYFNWLNELMEEREHSGMSQFRLNQIADYLHHFLRFVDDNHSSSNERLYIQTQDIRQYRESLRQSNVCHKEQKQRIDAVHFYFRWLTYRGYCTTPRLTRPLFS
ncbi:hypothetical protein KB973_003114 [Vibrio parahaemolyticus]|uniref:hypothetical protein n=1 Tax=Vibrio parahaemolyticus TaxID=670 RepID=UPI00112119B5|nr:hypothetical protein [Vibrio parahaemolyticus]EHK0034153.1 hypothetical protein [Vibrio parahaemolyticus]MBE4151689.1 hypothetical protein [Vibrio parahaemolyticus]TOL18156.1 hypothetical protein CGI04_13830 [Vibrio parahaemolyticus]